jgi:hypothetical protein
MREMTNNTKHSPINSTQDKTLEKEGNNQMPNMEKGKEPTMQHFYMSWILGSTLY